VAGHLTKGGTFNRDEKLEKKTGRER